MPRWPQGFPRFHFARSRWNKAGLRSDPLRIREKIQSEDVTLLASRLGAPPGPAQATGGRAWDDGHAARPAASRLATRVTGLALHWPAVVGRARACGNCCACETRLM